MKKDKIKIVAADIAECAIFVALMVAGAYVQIPFYPVALTFQTVISVLAGLLLGWKKGMASMAVYCFMGLVGVPVFSAGGGIFYVLKPSFGYIIGFIVSALAGGLIVSGGRYSFKRCLVAALVAFVANYAVGVPYFAIAWKFFLNGTGLGAAMVTYNLVYMPKDLVLSVLAAMLAYRVAPYLSGSGTRLKKDK